MARSDMRRSQVRPGRRVQVRLRQVHGRATVVDDGPAAEKVRERDETSDLREHDSEKADKGHRLRVLWFR
jgi:hypothetical protein